MPGGCVEICLYGGIVWRAMFQRRRRYGPKLCDISTAPAQIKIK
jgi:hypothetical protein